MTVVIIPLEILPVAVANAAIPEATAGAVVAATPNGAPIKMLVVVPTYPLPPFTTVIAEIVPEADTVAVRAADTGFTSFTILTPMLFMTKAELSSS